MGEMACIQEKYEETKLPYGLSFCWFILASTLVVFLNEDIAFFEGYGIRFDLWGFYLIAFSSFAVCLSYLIFAHCRFGVKVRGSFLTLFLILAIGNAVGLLMFPKAIEVESFTYLSRTYSDVRYELCDADRIRYLVSFSITCFYFYILWAIAPKCLKNDRICDVFLICGVLISLIAIAYSWATEWREYFIYFDKNAEPTFSGFPTSFLGNSNTFASLLLYGIVSTWVLQARRHCWVNYLLGFVFTLQILLVFSKTCLLLLLVFWPAYLIYRYIATVKAHPVRSSILLGVFILGIAGSITAWWALAHAFPDGVFGNYWFHIIKLFKEDDASTLFTRIADCNRLFETFDSPFAYVFGLGAINMEWFLGALNGSPEGCVGFTHNGLIYQFASGGFIRTLVYSVLLIYALYAFVKAMAKGQKTAFPLCLGFLLMLGHGFSETTSFLEGNAKGVLGVLTLIYPVLIPMVNERKPVIGKMPVRSSRVWTLSGFYYVSPLFAFGSLLPGLARGFGFSLPLGILLCLACLAVGLVVPLIMNIARKESFGKDYLAPLCVCLLVFVSFFALSFLLPLNQRWSGLGLLVLASCSVCFFLMSLPPLARRACPGFIKFIGKCEDFSCRVHAFFASRNARREERYYMPRRNGKAREALHY